MQVTDLLSLLNSHKEGEFLDVADFNGYTFGTCRTSGTSPYWEMHPETDEFFYVLDGLFEVTLLFDSGTELRKIPAGSVGVVPKGVWHRPAAPDGAAFLYFTPGETLHSEAEDPRV